MITSYKVVYSRGFVRGRSGGSLDHPGTLE